MKYFYICILKEYLGYHFYFPVLTASYLLNNIVSEWYLLYGEHRSTSN